MATRNPFAHAPFLLFVGIFALYAPSLTNGFAFDDNIHIVGNPLIRSIRNALSSFGLPTFPGNLYRPLTNLSNALVFSMFELDPRPYHLCNVLLHATNTMLVYTLVRRIAAEIAIPAAAVFGCLPIHLETVANVTGRAELLSVFFGLSAATIAFHDRTPVTMLAISALVLLSLLSKESGIVWLPLMLLIGASTPKRLVVIAIVSVGAYSALRWNALGARFISSSTIDPLDNPLITLSTPERMVWALGLLGRYSLLTLFPWKLGADYSFRYFPTEEVWFIAPFACLTASLLLLSLLNRAARLPLLWFFIAFAPTANLLFPIGTIFGERLAYAPSIGIAMCSALFWRHASVSFSLVVGAYALVVLNTIPVWRDDSSLFAHQVIVSPQSAKALSNHAVALRNEKKLDEAMLAARAAFALCPWYSSPPYTIGTIYLAKGLRNGALHWFNKALAINPSHIATLTSMGRMQVNSGDNEGAKGKFRAILEIDPFNISAHNGMIAVAINQRQRDEARGWIAATKRLDPSNHELRRLEKLASKQLESGPTE